MKTKLVLNKTNQKRFERLEAPLRTAEVALPSEGPRQSADAYTLYLREVGKTPLITPKEEIALAIP